MVVVLGSDSFVLLLVYFSGLNDKTLYIAPLAVEPYPTQTVTGCTTAHANSWVTSDLGSILNAASTLGVKYTLASLLL
jgi:hypothetical protein